MTRLHVHIPVRWSDLDAHGHVNNARMFTLLEEARIAAFWCGGPASPPTAVLETGAGAAVLTLIAAQQIEYRAPIPYHREPLDVELWMGRLGGASLQTRPQRALTYDDETARKQPETNPPWGGGSMGPQAGAGLQ